MKSFVRISGLALVSVFIFCFVNVISGQNDAPEKICFESSADSSLGSSHLSISDACVGCICEASTHCNLTLGCINGGALCGPFLISRPFWIDSGRCVTDDISPTDPLAFEKCSIDLKCASKTIRSYLHAFAKDCNGDQLVTCEDYVMIHKNGGYTCGEQIGGEYWDIFTECRDLVLKNGANI